MEELLRILHDLHPDVDFGTADDLIGDGILDSLDIVTLITEINSAQRRFCRRISARQRRFTI